MTVKGGSIKHARALDLAGLKAVETAIPGIITMVSHAQRDFTTLIARVGVKSNSQSSSYAQHTRRIGGLGTGDYNPPTI
jgi:hypothetical protein